MAETQRRASARQQVAEQQASDIEMRDRLTDLFKERLARSEQWFARVVPAHVDSDRFLELAKQHIKTTSNAKLMLACVQQPDSLMVALIDCARYGLTVGDTYHLVPFWDKHSSTYVVTGMRDYKGEIELIYRSGMVDAVFYYAVRGHEGAKAPDQFLWKPGMVFPEHVIADDGLADADDRGYLRGAYAYARLATGGYSPVVVMSKSAVLRTRPANAPAEFWGPEWPAEGPNTEAMWVKGPVHRLYPRVPHSAEHMAEVQRSAARAVEASQALALPPPGVAAVGPADAPEMLTGSVVPPPDGERRGSARSQVETVKPAVVRLRREIAGLFASMNFGSPDDGGQRAVASMLIRESPQDEPIPVQALRDLDQPHLGRLAAKLEVIRREATEAGREPSGDLQRLARAATEKGGSGDGG